MPDVASLRAELEQINRSINDLNREINRLTERLAPRITSYQSKKEKYDRDNAMLLSGLQSVEARAYNNLELNKEYNSILNSLNMYIENHNNKINLYRNKRNTYDRRVDVLNEKVTYYNSIRNDPDEDREKLRRLKAEIVSEKLALTQLETELQEISDQLNAEVEVIDEKNEDLRKRKQNIETESASIDAESTRLNNWSAAQDQIDNELKRESTQISVDQGIISSKRTQLGPLNIKKQQLIEQISRIESDAQYLIVAKGQLTFDAEGTEGGSNHTRLPHIPTSASGLTIGRGYDLKERTKLEAFNDLTAAGIPRELAEVYASAVGLHGDEAGQYIINHRRELKEISLQQQKTLFELTYNQLENDVIRICNQRETIEAYGRVNWPNLNPIIRDIVVDLRFRGDYHTTSRGLIQKHIANNDLPAFSAAISNVNNWPGVPADRFKRRKEYLQNAMLVMLDHEEIPSVPFVKVTDFSMFKAIEESSSTNTNTILKREYIYAKL